MNRRGRRGNHIRREEGKGSCGRHCYPANHEKYQDPLQTRKFTGVASHCLSAVQAL